MNKIEQWLNAIINEDGHRMSAGSLRTIEMIRRELARPQNLQQCSVSGSVCCGAELIKFNTYGYDECSDCGKTYHQQTDR